MTKRNADTKYALQYYPASFTKTAHTAKKKLDKREYHMPAIIFEFFNPACYV